MKTKTMKYGHGAGMFAGAIIAGLLVAYFDPDRITYGEAFDLAGFYFFMFNIHYFFIAEEG